MAEWSHLVRWLRRRCPDLAYAACKEEGSQSGMLHLHVVITRWRYVPQPEISAEWARLTGAKVVHIQRIRGEHAASYVSKYVAKDLQAARKHVTFSKLWPKLPPPGLRLALLESVDACGPRIVREVTADGGIVDYRVPDCRCFGEIVKADVPFHLWLRWQTARLWPASPAASGP